MGGHIRTEPLEKRFILGIRHGIRSVILGGSFDLWVTGKREGREFNINITQMSYAYEAHLVFFRYTAYKFIRRTLNLVGVVV